MAKDTVDIVHGYGYHQNDVLKAFNDIIAERYGDGDIKEAVKAPWARRTRFQIPMPFREALTYWDIEVAFKERQSVISGQMRIKGIEGVFTAENSHIIARVVQDQYDEVRKLLDDIEERLDTSSIFRGKAVTNRYEFFDPDHLVDRTLIYSDEVLTGLEDHVWTVLRDLEKCRESGIRTQRKVLLSGKFRSGKTMALLKSMRIAVDNGWTAVYIEPTREPAPVMEAVLAHTVKYQPVLIAMENFDQEQREGNQHAFRYLMEHLDGAKSKIGDLFVLLTTNYPNELKPELLGPGRIDQVIDFGQFGQEEAIRLLKVLIPESYLSQGIDWSAVGEACKGYMPGFLTGVAEGAMLPAVRMRGDGIPRVTQDMLVKSAKGLEIQHKKCSKQKFGLTAD